MQTVEELESAIINEFIRLKKPEDVNKIAQLAGVSKQSVYNVYHKKKYGDKLLKTMVEYYKSKKQYLHESLTELNSIQ